MAWWKLSTVCSDDACQWNWPTVSTRLPIVRFCDPACRLICGRTPQKQCVSRCHRRAAQNRFAGYRQLRQTVTAGVAYLQAVARVLDHPWHCSAKAGLDGTVADGAGLGDASHRDVDGRLRHAGRAGAIEAVCRSERLQRACSDILSH